MIKQVRYILGTWILLLVMVLNVSFTSDAYTEEEKQQAKAWLSAHGYSPDMGGASQAYQDYLNGKFDEELGYDTNGDGIPAATTEGTSQSVEETTTKAEESTTESAEKQKQGSSTETKPSDKKETAESEKQKNTSTVETEQQIQEEEQSQTAKTTLQEGRSAKQKSAKQQESGNDKTLYRTDKKEIYKKAAIVTVLSVLVMLLIDLFLHLKKRKSSI